MPRMLTLATDGRRQEITPPGKHDLSFGYFNTDTISSVTDDVYAYVEGNPISAADPDGLTKLILLPKTDLTYAAAVAAPDVPGQLTVFSHGSQTSVAGMNASQLASRIKKSGLWKTGMNIKLDACKTGSGDQNIAQDLADKMRTNVIAPNARTLTFGEADLGPWHSWNIPYTQRTIPLWPGSWNTFTPQK